jgi:hypothetical protein
VGKVVLPETELFNKLNSALAQVWQHPGYYLRVESLRQVADRTCNWDVDTYSTGGPDLQYAGECEALRKRVRAELAAKYEVFWPSGNFSN